MNTFIIVSLCIIGWIGAIILIISFCKAAAPKTELERIKEDLEQMYALGYFDENITSGSPVCKK